MKLKSDESWLNYESWTQKFSDLPFSRFSHPGESMRVVKGSRGPGQGRLRCWHPSWPRKPVAMMPNFNGGEFGKYLRVHMSTHEYTWVHIWHHMTRCKVLEPGHSWRQILPHGSLLNFKADLNGGKVSYCHQPGTRKLLFLQMLWNWFFVQHL